MTEKALFGSKKARNVAISTVAIVGVTIVLGILIFNGKKDGSSALRSLPAEARGAAIDTAPGVQEADKEVTPKYQEMMNKVSRAAVDTSEKNGLSGIERQGPVRLEEGPAPPVSSAQPPAQVPYTTQSAPKDTTLAVAAATNSIAALVAKWTPGTHQTIVYSDTPQQQSSAGLTASAADLAAQVAPSSAVAPVAIIRAGDVHAIGRST